MGIGQWLVLRQKLERVHWWFLMTPIAIILGAVTGGILGGILQDTMDGVWSPRFGIRSPSEPGRTQLASLAAVAFVGGWMGLVLAAAQWRILRRTANQPVLWLSAHVIGLGLGEVLMSVTPRTLYATIASGVVVACVSSFALVRCLRQFR